jgi:cysteine-rich repeat protein
VRSLLPLLPLCALAALTACPTGPGGDAGPADSGPFDAGAPPADSGCETCDAGTPVAVPEAWADGHCSAAWYGDGSCDCGCLADDIDCPSPYDAADCAFVLCPVGQALDPADPAGCIPACGDGERTGDEACDDGNNDDGDGCTADCRWELPAAWAAACGVGTYGARDGCDCGCGAVDPDCADDTLASCELNRCGDRLDGPWVPDLSDPTTCVLNQCGDQFPGEVETCDDGNTTPGDGCDALCQVEPGFVCTPGTCQTSTCGDGLFDPWAGELCDDGNSDDSDGCTTACTLSPPGLDAPLPGSCEGRCEVWLGRASDLDSATCFCDPSCEALGDCCADLASVCRPAAPSCAAYCDEVMAACPGAYASVAACALTCTSTGWRLGEPGAASGNTVACRQRWAAVAASADAGVAEACAAAGPGGGGVCGQRCDVFCDAIDNNCAPDATPFDPSVDGGVSCAAACPLFAATGAPGDTSGDTFQCRLTWAQLPANSDDALCGHAGPQSPSCTGALPGPVDGGAEDGGAGRRDAGVSDAG